MWTSRGGGRRWRSAARPCGARGCRRVAAAVRASHSRQPPAPRAPHPESAAMTLLLLLLLLSPTLCPGTSCWGWRRRARTRRASPSLARWVTSLLRGASTRAPPCSQPLFAAGAQMGVRVQLWVDSGGGSDAQQPVGNGGGLPRGGGSAARHRRRRLLDAEKVMFSTNGAGHVLMEGSPVSGSPGRPRVQRLQGLVGTYHVAGGGPLSRRSHAPRWPWQQSSGRCIETGRRAHHARCIMTLVRRR